MKSNEITVHQNAKPANISGQIIYQVQPGDSFETIAKRNNVTVQSIKQINNTIGNKLYTGQHLKINSSISEKEKDLMARLVTAEAGGESYKGKVAVAKVILNRVHAKGLLQGLFMNLLNTDMHLLLLQMEELINLQAQKPKWL